MSKSRWRSLGALRVWFAAAAAAFLLAACGGGGDGGNGQTRTIDVGNPPIQGNWQLEVVVDGANQGTLAVAAGDVPSQSEASAVSANTILQQIAATRFRVGYTVNVTGNQLTASNVNTAYTLVINSFTVSDFTGCGTCGVGSTVSFKVTAQVSESGTLDGNPVPATSTLTIVFVYRRTA